MTLTVSIEINGVQKELGCITGTTPEDARFSYSKNYLLSSDACAISINLPLKEEAFTVKDTRAFFEGLLPEGFTRHTVAGWLNVDESNYLLLLKYLGCECLGAIKVFDEAEGQTEPNLSYEKLSSSDMLSLAKDGVLKTAEFAAESRLSLAGASGKTGLMYHNNEWYLPKGDAPSTHIIKQSHVRFNDIVVNEMLCQRTAEKLGISVPHSFIIKPEPEKPEQVLFASKRFDRFISDSSKTVEGIKVPFRLHQEDFAQAMGVLASAKYESDPSQQFLKKMFNIIKNNSMNPLEDQLFLWDRIVFNYLIGNTDCHIKNFSLIYSADLKTVRLAPCYDTICTTIYNGTTNNMAFNIGGKYDIQKINKDDFEKAALECGLGVSIAMKHFDEMQYNFKDALSSAASDLNAGNLVQSIIAQK